MSEHLNRLGVRFASLKAQRRKALVIYATSGDPAPGISGEVFRAAAEAGADVIEIGVPFSDPTADGPAIQAASERALAAGGGFATACADARAVRDAHPDTGVILFGYLNPFLQARSAAIAMRDAGADGVLCVDLPPEEDTSLGPTLREAGLKSIRLIAPTSTDLRIKAAATSGGGFLYCVAVTGVTGAAGGDPATLKKLIARSRKLSNLPVVIGFGINTPDDAVKMAELCDGVVVGSAVVRLVAEHGRNAPSHVAKLVSSLRKALG